MQRHLCACVSFTDPPPTVILTLSLHDALPIYDVPFTAKVSLDLGPQLNFPWRVDDGPVRARLIQDPSQSPDRSEEHTSELQSRRDLVCRLLLETQQHKH